MSSKSNELSLRYKRNLDFLDRIVYKIQNIKEKYTECEFFENIELENEIKNVLLKFKNDYFKLTNTL